MDRGFGRHQLVGTRRAAVRLTPERELDNGDEVISQMSVRPRSKRWCVTAAAVATVLTGCSGGDSGADPTTATDRSESTAPTTAVDTTTSVETTTTIADTTTSVEATPTTVEATTATTAAPEPAADGTAPVDATPTPEGTKLAFGEPAVVTLDTELPDELVALTVLDVRAGTADDLAELAIEDVGRKAQIFYIDYSVVNVSAPESDADYLPNMSFQFGGLSDDDDYLVPVIKFVAFAPCESDLVEELAIGASTTQCEIFLSETGRPVDRVFFAGDFSSEAITWR